MNFPNSFVEELSYVPGIDPNVVLAALDSAGPVSIRFNPYKLAGRPEGRQVPWSRYGFYLPARPVFTTDPMHHGGVYYVQEAGSMFIEHVFRTLNPGDERMRILDLCAAPGGKATLLATVAGLESTVVANEVNSRRAAALADNVIRWGLGNVAVTQNDPSHFENLKHFFDLVLVDAPCSGEGMFRKDKDALGQWNTGNVNLCSGRQRRILSEIWDAVVPGGYIIYSTCTFNIRENEENLRWLADNYECSGVRIPLGSNWEVIETETVSGTGSSFWSYRFLPGITESEGFYATVVRKMDGKVKRKGASRRKSPLVPADKVSSAEIARWVAQPEFMRSSVIGDNFYLHYSASYDDVVKISENLSVIHSGIPVGQMFKGKLKPSHALALFHDIDPDIVRKAELPEELAVDYLRKNHVAPEFFGEGINLVTCNTVPIGWAKRIGSRVNNLYPAHMRIMNL